MPWAVKWIQDSALDGHVEHFMWNGGKHRPLLFETRVEARSYIRARYGYIATRHDLRRAPHGWKMPQATRVEVKLIEARA